MSTELISAMAAVFAVAVTLVGIIVGARVARRLSREQAAVQERLAAIEEARRQDELKPRLTLRWIPDPEDGRLEWVNEGPLDLDDLSFEIIERSGAGWQPLRGLRYERLTLRDGSFGAVRIGEPVSRDVVRTEGSEHDGGTARFRMTCRSGDRLWVLARECEVPPVRIQPASLPQPVAESTTVAFSGCREARRCREGGGKVGREESRSLGRF